MPGNWSRVKTWITKEKLLFSDLNAEFDNVISNQEPLKFDDYSLNVTQMQQQTTPGGVGSESLATTLAGELERLRYVIARIIGKTYWYDDPGTNLQGSIENAAFYIPFDGDQLTATSAYADCISRGAIINHISRTTAGFTSSQIDTTNKKFGNSSFSCVTGNGFAYPGYWGDKDQGSLSLWFRTMLNGSYLAYNPLLGMELYLDGSTGKLTARMTRPTAASETTKNTVSVQGSVSRSADGTFRNATMVWSNNASQGAATDRIQLYYEGAAEGSALTNQSYTQDNGADSIWFFGARPNTPTWDKFSAMSVVPSAEASSPWTSAVSTGTSTVSGGVLTMSNTGSTGYVYNKTTNIDLNVMTIEFKVKVSLPAAGFTTTSAIQYPFVSVRDDSMNRGFYMDFNNTRLRVFNDSAGSSALWGINHDFSEWTIVRIVTAGATNPICDVYINGLHRGRFTCESNDATASDDIRFGIPAASANAFSVQWEWFAYVGTASTPPIQANPTSGNLDDIFCSRSLISTSTISSLQTATAKSFFKRDIYNGITRFNYWTAKDYSTAGTAVNSGANFVVISFGNQDSNTNRYYFMSDGKSVIRINAKGAFDAVAVGGNVYTVISLNGEMVNVALRENQGNPGLVIGTNTGSSAISLALMLSSEFTIATPGLHYVEVLASSASASNTYVGSGYSMDVVNYRQKT